MSFPLRINTHTEDDGGILICETSIQNNKIRRNHLRKNQQEVAPRIYVIVMSLTHVKEVAPRTYVIVMSLIHAKEVAART